MKKLAPLKSIYSFIAVAETGSMTEAANELSVSHSAVSQAIKSLETQIGQALFIRAGRKVVLNAAGRRYYKQVAPAIEQIVAATQNLIDEQQSQRLTLNMVHSLAMHWWIPRVNRFNQYAPQLDIRISNLIGSFVMENEGIDVAIIHGKTDDWPDYYCELLARDELVMAASPELVNDETTPASLLAQYPAIVAANDRRKYDWQVWCENHQLSMPPFANNLSFSASIQAVQATIRKLGVFVTHRQFIRDDVSHGSLVEVGQPVLNPHQDFYFACQPEKLKNEHVLILRNWLRSEFST
ncbi:LysR family transcriptional regulator [Vibrio coralliilyticus]|jgi:DNA-binding transcriptional LysR family regulator|uniref:LysR family transcriptional regulator n=1 Tax=Vibrio coralliilyticus TaxID=190893 RepID=A0A1B1VG77_9VIBR|nr:MULTISPECIES: LysR substrate-binding domain-containing protein [Vibrio]ANW26205.1 LysR family transcriptional regulator [Vibrio coralliilyticus]ERB63779.1 LysR family transcriptional regulator [Vibrio coralliilyticus OCN008]KJY72237.1 LysR family transcriptional regulator [Vibrio coralliilyticus]NOI76133.1 LysR family transcriptional regulator [Vibrio coralliilyticus]NOJ23816.1 LysR family transcriptional regulator [Vibrio coralliilyticus]